MLERFEIAIKLSAEAVGEEWRTAIVCWDYPGPTWRHEVFERYKANRPLKPRALVKALDECRMTDTFLNTSSRGFEADDLIATFARHGRRSMHAVFILSEDKDLMQLVDGERGACVVLNRKLEVIGASAVVDHLGVAPDRVRHYLSWLGDATDGLPGVPGYGPVKAAQRARDGDIGDRLTYDLTELVDVPGLGAP